MDGTHQGGDGTAPLPLPSSMVSASSPSAGPTSSASGDGTDGLELLDASELEGPNAAGLLDALDALLGEAGMEGFGEQGNSEEHLLPFREGNI